jgi:hypothetical protein
MFDPRALSTIYRSQYRVDSFAGKFCLDLSALVIPFIGARGKSTARGEPELYPADIHARCPTETHTHRPADTTTGRDAGRYQAARRKNRSRAFTSALMHFLRKVAQSLSRKVSRSIPSQSHKDAGLSKEEGGAISAGGSM